MIINFLKKNPLILIIPAALALLSSCANLPGRENPVILATEPVENISSLNVSGNEENSNEVISREQADVQWVQPDNSLATVTPIVLPVEKRGDEALIVRSNVVSGSYNNTVYYTESTPVPTAVVGGMRDEMAVYSFNPINGAVVLPGQSLHLDVMLRNTGTTTWMETYKVVDISASPMAVLREFSMPWAVAPNDTVLITIYMVAPSSVGSYTETFQIQDAYGVVFGEFNYVLTVGEFSSITEIPTLTATLTPTYYSADGITATPDELWWMCTDPLRSQLQDCYQFCVLYGDREEFKYCYYDGVRYTTPVP